MFESAGGDFGQWLSNLFSGASTGSGGSYPGNAMAGADWSAMQQAGYQVPDTSDPSLYSNTTGGGGMNWAGLASGLSNLSKSLGGSGSSSGSNTLQTSPSVSGTVSGGTLQPAGGGGGASALASMLSSRNQLAQYLMLAAMQGKGRGRSGQGLLG
jgi:hypothetical protein